MKKILVIDGNSIINRAYYGVRPLTTKSGKYTNAIFGMINIISRHLEQLRPDYAAVAFDVHAPTFRHKMYEGYKAGRHPTPPELLSQFDDAKECLTLMGMRVLELPGYEADDIQGTVAHMAYALPDTESYVLSGDRDLLQLIGEKVTVLLATNAETLTMREPQFREKYGISPQAFVDMKALMGDSSDNIPGVGGIGEKTAATLLSAFGTLDGIYENLDDKRITKGVREKLVRDKENAYLSKTLATIDTNAPLALTADDLLYRPMDAAGLYQKFTELELHSLIRKFSLSDAVATVQAAAPEAEKQEDLLSLSAEEICAMQADTVSVLTDNENYYLHISQKSIQYSGELSKIKPIFDRAKNIICYDGKKLWHTLHDAGIHPSEQVRFLDLMLYSYVIDPANAATGIPSLAAIFLGKSLPPDAWCPSLLPALERAMRERIRDDGGLYILDEIEIPLLPILADMETAGLKIDVAGMREFGDALGTLADELAERIYRQAGGCFNIQSPKQLGDVLYNKLGLTPPKKKKSGFSTDAETLEELRPFAPIVDDILEYRQVTKLKSTYATALVEAADDNDRVHTEFKQALTATGRLSSTDPNLQNIPIRTKMGREMRRYFIAEPGCSLVDADYSQIELRLLAHISDDYHMIESFRDGCDIHRTTAAAVFGIPEEDVTEDLRKRAKAVNFGIVYGISGFSLAKDIGTSAAEANRYIRNYMHNYPGIERYLTEVVERAKEDGGTKTPLGRIRHIPELKAQNAMVRAFGKRVAMNAPIQGAAADIMKIAMIRMWRRLKRDVPQARLVMQVHDEVLVEVPDRQIDAVMRIVREEMETAVSLSVPLIVDVTHGKNWLEQA